MAVCDNIKEENYTVEKGQRLFQLVATDSSPIEYELVDSLEMTTRGSGGFNPADITEILVVLITRKYAESRPAENPQAKNEYRVTETGRQNLETARSFLRMPGIADLLGLPEYEEKKDDEEK